MTMEDFLQWCSEAPLSRTIKDLGDDFSDGVLVAEVIKHYIPTLVDLATYQTTREYKMKLINWKSLNRMVFKKLGFEVKTEDLECVCQCQTTAVNEMLLIIRQSVEQYLIEEQRRKLFPAAKVKRDHLNQKLESIRNSYSRQKTSLNPEKTPLKKTRGDMLVLPSKGTVAVERHYNIPPMTAPELHRKTGLGEPKVKEVTSVTFNPVPVTSDDHRILSDSEEKISSLEQQLKEANSKITMLSVTLHKAEQENADLKALIQTFEEDMRRILVELETLKEEKQRQDNNLAALQQQIGQVQQCH